MRNTIHLRAQGASPVFQLSAVGAAVVALCALLTAAPALAADPAPAPEEAAVTLDSVVITSRNREEIAQKVPIPVSVIGGAALERDNTVAVDDLTKKVPGLTATTPNARRTGISIRGIGKASGNDSMEAAVGLIVDNVFMSHVGMSYQDFTDLDRIEVLRGPQGTLLGKNTTLGAINIVSKAPSFAPQVAFEAGIGPRNSLNGKASVSDALAEDVLAYRASFFVDKQAGDLENVNTEGGRWLEKHRYGGRLQFLLTPRPDLSLRLNTDLAESNERSNVKPVMSDPDRFADGSSRTANGGRTYSSRLARAYFGGYQPLIGSREQVDLNQAQPLLTRNRGVSAEVNWDIGGGLTLTSISARRALDFDARNDGDQTKFSIYRSGTLLAARQTSQEFRLTSAAGGVLDYQAGLFYMHNEANTTERSLYGRDAGAFYASNAQYTALSQTAAGVKALQDALDNVYVTTLTTPQTDSLAAFGQANWHLSEKATLTLGLRETHERKEGAIYKQAGYYDGSALQSTGNANADAVRAAQVGTVFGLRDGEPIKSSALGWLINPSYQLHPDVLLYASAGSGEKSGSVQYNTANGGPLNVSPEKSLDFELGVKSLLLERTLLLNLNLYHTRIKDYQATTSVPDASQATGFRSILGNIPGIHATGIELDGAYKATRELSLSFGAAYNKATYSDWRNATCPTEIVTSAANPTCDNTGKQITAAPKLTVNLGADYKRPLGNGRSAHAWVNNVYRSKQNLEAALSAYGWQDAYHVSDIGIGLIGKQGQLEIDLIARNVFDTKYSTSITNFSNSNGVTEEFGPRRSLALVLRSKF